MSDPKCFEPLTDEHGRTCLIVGKQLYLALEKKFKDDSDAPNDLIMNSLCSALICLLHSKVDKDNRPIMIQVIHKILTNNCQ